jgi:hypothetical protein
MPHLYFHKQYWRISNDDLFIPLSCTILGRIFWTALLALYFVINLPGFTPCLEGIFLLVYLLISVFFLILIILMDFIIMRTSLQGSIIETEKRSNINKQLYIRLVITYLQALSAFYGIFAISYAPVIPCDGSSETTAFNHFLFGIIIALQYLDICCISCCCYFTSSNLQVEVEEEDETIEETKEEIGKEGAENDNGDEDLENQKKSQVSSGERRKRVKVLHKPASKGGIEPITGSTIWMNRIERMMKRIEYYTCHLLDSGGNVNDELHKVAEFLAKFFHHDGFLDLVPSDIITGMILVRKEQDLKRKASYEHAILRKHGNVVQRKKFISQKIEDIEENIKENEIDEDEEEEDEW